MFVEIDCLGVCIVFVVGKVDLVDVSGDFKVNKYLVIYWELVIDVVVDLEDVDF